MEELHEKWGKGGGTMFRTQRSRCHGESKKKFLFFLIILPQNASTPSSDSSFLISLGRGGIVII